MQTPALLTGVKYHTSLLEKFTDTDEASPGPGIELEIVSIFGQKSALDGCSVRVPHKSTVESVNYFQI